MRKRICALILATTLAACQSSPDNNAATPLRPEIPQPTVDLEAPDDSLPLPLPRHHRSAVAYYEDILNHPWVQEQPDVPEVHTGMIADIRSIQEMVHALPPPRMPEDDQHNALVQALKKLQRSLDTFDFNFPSDLYSVLNIPSVDPKIYASPTPFQIYKRLYLGDTHLGFPIYLDVRLFDLNPQEDPTTQQTRIEAIITWHLNTLIGGETAFEKFTAGDRLILVGHGDKNTDHLDNTHGFLTQDRGVFTAFALRGSRLAALHVDAPWEHVASHLPVLQAMVNRPIAKLPDDTPLHLSAG